MGNEAVAEDVFEPDAKRLSQAYAMLSDRSPQTIGALTELAERGSVWSMLGLGYAYTDATLGTPDLAASEMWCRKAAEAGLVCAHYYLGRLYLMQSRYAEAKQEFEFAASKDYAPAIHYLGRIAYFGWGVPSDTVKGKALFEAASTRGNLVARDMLARDMIRHGTWREKAKGHLSRFRFLYELIRTACVEGENGLLSDRFR